MLCYRCGSHVPDSSESCGTCGQKLAGGGVRQATATFSRRKLQGAPIEDAPYKPGDVVANRYEIKDAVGAGPIGFVFRAKDREVDVEVALKVINPKLAQTQEERKLFGRQLRLARKLSHQNLIRVYEEGEEQGRLFYTMQFLEGLNLRKIIDLRLQRGDFFTLREIEPILGQIANALDGAHKVGPHSDLKPENVIVLPDLLKVSDFGLGLAIPRLPFVQAVKQRKSDRYLAPEYVSGGEVDARADLYSLGVILGEMLSGLTPDGAVPELGKRNPDVPPPLEGLYRRALNSNPLARPKTATDLFDEFAEITRRVSPPPLRRNDPAPAVQRPRPGVPPPVPAMAAGPAATVELRRLDKPPPPVPDEDILSEELSLNGSSAELLPADATQPLDDGFLPPPPPADADETQLLPSFPGGIPPEDLAEPTVSRQLPRQGRAGMWIFVLFTLAGLSLGAGGGYWLLGRTRPPKVEAPPPKVAPPPSPGGEVTGRPAGSTGATGAVAVTPPPEKTPGTATDLAKDPGSTKREEAEAARRVAEQRAAQARARREAEAAEEALRKEQEETARREEEARREAEAKAKAAEEARRAEEKRRAEERRKAEEEKGGVVVASAAGGRKDCPDGMKRISAGAFRMGTARNDPMMGFDEKILSTVSVGAYCIDLYEYPNRRGTTPRTGVSWNDARRLCEARGKRLCTEAEWERACKGPSNARFPYGNTFDADACNTEDALGEDRPLATAGRFHKCRSGYGIADLSGNVAEWTSSSYSGGADKAQKGGSFSKPDYAARCSARKNGSPSSRGKDVGFRCCADPG